MSKSETKWIDWHPEVGDVRPEKYRVRSKYSTCEWYIGRDNGPITSTDLKFTAYQIPAPEEKVTSMKYWQPRVDPISRGWTLADVPDDVLCEVEHPSHGTCFAKRTEAGSVWSGGKCISNHSDHCRVIRVIDPIPPGAMTLDKVPDLVNCCLRYRGSIFIGHKSREKVFCGHGDGKTDLSPSGVEVTHILDPIPDVSYTLETLPVGRVIETDCGAFFFKDGQSMVFIQWYPRQGSVGPQTVVLDGNWHATDYIMELKEVV